MNSQLEDVRDDLCWKSIQHGDGTREVVSLFPLRDTRGLGGKAGRFVNPFSSPSALWPALLVADLECNLACGSLQVVLMG